MAATQTVDQFSPSCNSTSTPSSPEPGTNNARVCIVPHGVVTLYGYGIAVRVDRGHLVVEDGICADRRYGRFPRVGHGLRRLVVIGADGMVSLAALRAARHPSLRRYLGQAAEGFPGQNNHQFRVLVAEIVADAVCADIVSRNADANPESYANADWDRYYAEYSEYMTRFLPIAHRTQVVIPETSL